MGKFDGPHFQVEKNIVSVFVAKCPLEIIPNDYFEEDYSGDDEANFNQFSADFGFGYYDHDFVEGAGMDKTSSIKAIIDTASYGKSFSQEASNTCNITGSEHVFLMYNFEYDPNITNIVESNFYQFIGCFTFDETYNKQVKRAPSGRWDFRYAPAPYLNRYTLGTALNLNFLKR